MAESRHREPRGWEKHGVFPALCVAMLFFLGSGCAVDETADAQKDLYVREVSGNIFPDTPVRGEVKPLRYTRGSFTYRCTECHKDFDTVVKQGDLQGEHADIDARFDHGRNTQCLNCHHPGNRNVYVGYGDTEIPPDQPEQLCGKCHGTMYRDWRHGVHGRSNGYWDTSQGARTRLVCTQCHDPHNPAFKPMRPDPAPIYSRLAAHPPQEATHEQ